MPLDRVILVNEDDELLGEMDKVEAHRGKGKLHRAISAYLFRKNKDNFELLVQQRSKEKIVGAELWANTVCGNVRPGEDYRECADRRLFEELGIKKKAFEPVLSELYKFQYFVRCNEEFSENEIDQVFIGVIDGDLELDLNPEEVQKTTWISWNELLKALPEKPDWVDSAESIFPEPVILSIEGKSFKLAPWFVIMLYDPNLLRKVADYFSQK